MPQIEDPRSLAYYPGAEAPESGIPLWLRPVGDWWSEQQKKLREWLAEQERLKQEALDRQQAMEQARSIAERQRVNPMSGQMSPQASSPIQMTAGQPQTPDQLLQMGLAGQTPAPPTTPFPRSPQSDAATGMLYSPAAIWSPPVMQELNTPPSDLAARTPGATEQGMAETQGVMKWLQNPLQNPYTTIPSAQEEVARKNQTYRDFMQTGSGWGDNAGIALEMAGMAAGGVGGTAMPTLERAAAMTSPALATAVNFFGSGVGEQATARGILHQGWDWLVKERRWNPTLWGQNAASKVAGEFLQAAAERGESLESAIWKVLNYTSATFDDIANGMGIKGTPAEKELATLIIRASQGAPAPVEPTRGGRPAMFDPFNTPQPRGARAVMTEGQPLTPQGTKPPTPAAQGTVPATPKSTWKPTTVIDFTSKRNSPLRKNQWAILTAENPNNTPATAEVNTAANAQLYQDLVDAGYNPIPVKGKYGGPDESSFLVPDMTEDDALVYGWKYQQESVLTPNGLMFQDGSVNPVNLAKIDFSGKQDNYFSIINVGGKDVKFTIPIDFETKVGALKPEVIESLKDPKWQLADSWVRDARAVLQQFAGDKWQTFARLLAATSANTPVDRNWELAVENLSQWLSNTPLTGMSTHMPNILRAIKNEPMRVRKVPNWAKTLLGDEDAVTIDTIIARAFGYPNGLPTGAAGERAYDIIEARIRRMATEAGVTPSAMAARIWSAARGDASGYVEAMAKFGPRNKRIQNDIDIQKSMILTADLPELEQYANAIGQSTTSHLGGTEGLREKLIKFLDGTKVAPDTESSIFKGGTLPGNLPPKGYGGQVVPGVGTQKGPRVYDPNEFNPENPRSIAGVPMPGGRQIAPGRPSSGMPTGPKLTEARSQWQDIMNRSGIPLERIVRDSPTPTQAREMVDFIYDYCRMSQFNSIMSAEEIVRVANKVAPKVDAELARLEPIAKQYPNWMNVYKSVKKLSKGLRTDDPDTAFLAIDELIATAHQNEPAILRQIFEVEQEPRAQDISTIIRQALDFQAHTPDPFYKAAPGGKPRPVIDPFNQPAGRGTRQFAPSNEGTFGPQGTRPEQPRPAGGAPARPQPGTPEWRAAMEGAQMQQPGPRLSQQTAPAPEPAANLGQNAPGEATGMGQTPPGGTTTPPPPRTPRAGAERPPAPGMAYSKHAQRMNDTYNGLIYHDRDIPEYEVQNNARKIASAVAQDEADPEGIIRIIQGEPTGSHNDFMARAIAAEERMLESGDMENLTDLLNTASIRATDAGQGNALLVGRYGVTSPHTAVGSLIAARTEEAARTLPNTPLGERLTGTSNSAATRVGRERRRQAGELRRSVSNARRIDLQQANALLSTWTCPTKR